MFGISFGNIFENKAVKTSIASIVLLILIVLTISPTRDDKQVTLRNEITGLKEFKQTINEVFVIAIMVAVLLPVFFFTSTEGQKPQPKRMTLPWLWSKIPREEIIKHELKEVESVILSGNYLWAPSSRNKNIYHLRYTDNQKHCEMNIAMYVLDDFVKFMSSPITAITTMPMGIESAQSRLIKTQETPARVIQTVGQLGITPEEVKRRLLEKEIESQNRSVEGDTNENEG